MSHHVQANSKGGNRFRTLVPLEAKVLDSLHETQPRSVLDFDWPKAHRRPAVVAKLVTLGARMLAVQLGGKRVLHKGVNKLVTVWVRTPAGTVALAKYQREHAPCRGDNAKEWRTYHDWIKASRWGDPAYVGQAQYDARLEHRQCLACGSHLSKMRQEEPSPAVAGGAL